MLLTKMNISLRNKVDIENNYFCFFNVEIEGEVEMLQSNLFFLLAGV